MNEAFATGEQFGVQLVGVIAILAWTVGTSLVTFYGIDYALGMRVTAEEEEEGLDASEHGAQSYTMAKLAGVTVEMNGSTKGSAVMSA